MQFSDFIGSHAQDPWILAAKWNKLLSKQTLLTVGWLTPFRALWLVSTGLVPNWYIFPIEWICSRNRKTRIQVCVNQNLKPDNTEHRHKRSIKEWTDILWSYKRKEHPQQQQKKIICLCKLSEKNYKKSIIMNFITLKLSIPSAPRLFNTLLTGSNE